MNKGKTLLWALVGLIIFSSPLAAFAAQNKEGVKAGGKAAQYTCVHHADITSETSGTCPKCLMALTKKPALKRSAGKEKSARRKP